MRITILFIAFLFCGMIYGKESFSKKIFFIHVNHHSFSYGKQVKSVFAHIGLDNKGFWYHVKHIPLELKNGFFNADIELNCGSYYNSYNPEQSFNTCGDVKVQYWLTFTDESTRISDVWDVLDVVYRYKSFGSDERSYENYEKTAEYQDIVKKLKDIKNTSTVSRSIVKSWGHY